MNATLAKKLRFSDVVYAIDTTPKSLRLWFQRDLVRIGSAKPEAGAWTTFNFLDIAILALTRRLVNFGVPVSEANDIANAVIEQMPGLDRLNAKTPAGALALLWRNSRLQVFQGGDRWRHRIVALYHSELDPQQDESFDPALPSGIADLREEIEPADAFVSIDIETTLRAAFERANESVNDGVDESSE